MRRFSIGVLLVASCGPAAAPAPTGATSSVAGPDVSARPAGSGWYCSPEGGPCARERIDCEELALTKEACVRSDTAHCFTTRVSTGVAFRCAATEATCAKARGEGASPCGKWD